MTTRRSSKPHDPSSADDAAHGAPTQERESNEHALPDESDEKYDTSRMACTD